MRFFGSWWLWQPQTSFKDTVCKYINVKMFCSCHVEQHLLYLKKTYIQLHRYGRLVVVVHSDDVRFVVHFWATKQRHPCILPQVCPQVCLKLWTEEPTDTQQSPTYLQYAGFYKGPSPFRLDIQHVSTSALSAWWCRKEGSNLGLKMRAESPSTDKTTIDLKEFHPFSAQKQCNQCNPGHRFWLSYWATWPVLVVAEQGKNSCSNRIMLNKTWNLNKISLRNRYLLLYALTIW